MRCPSEDRENEDLLLAHAARRLDAQRAAVLEEHLARCPACREYAAAQFAIWEALEGWEAPPVSADFDRRLYQRIERNVSWWEPVLRPLRTLLGSRTAPMAAAAALLIAAGLWIERPGAMPAVRRQSAHVEALSPDQAASALQEMQMMQEFSSLLADSTDLRM